MSIDQQVKELIAARFGVPVTEVTDGLTLRGEPPKGLGADELDLTELPMDLEDQFAIELTDEDVEAFTTVKSVIAAIERLTGA